jgi:hypothetical protein
MKIMELKNTVTEWGDPGLMNSILEWSLQNIESLNLRTVQ